MLELGEITSWYEELVKTGSISEERRKVLDEVMAMPEVSKYVKETVLMRSDYSRKQDELTKQQKAIEAEQTKIAQLQDDLLKWKNTNEGKFQHTLKELESARNREAALANAIEVQYGLKASEILSDPSYVAPAAPPQNGAGAFTKEQFEAMITDVQTKTQERIQGVVNDMLSWQNASLMLATEAQKLGITDYSPLAVFDQMKKTSDWDPNRAFDTLYNAGEKRRLQTEAEIKKQIDAAREEGIARGRQEAMLPQSHAAPADSYAAALIKGTPSEDGPGVSVSSEHLGKAADKLAELTGVPRRAY